MPARASGAPNARMPAVRVPTKRPRMDIRVLLIVILTWVRTHDFPGGPSDAGSDVRSHRRYARGPRPRPVRDG
ncbi:hypothetical protein PSA01_27540 [Pseudonocardia saturnea]|uniref:Uncharacterized protein n=1 Tax=Pseudonocardia saturnea TaxID=33909 RepID=A0ABQ0RYI0_9PSEU|nr:hypothetical protein Pdca_64760 [Pseudonocardia autotrophica]GEC25725.1 hypothetical protein PSA01_27540 [Pseudonocardia saturnea]